MFHLLSEGTELFLEGDPERPRFSSIVTPARKFLGDNADAIYHQAVIRGDRSYRVTGVRDREVYISFTIHGPDPAGGINGPVLADMNDRQFEVDADGNVRADPQPRRASRELGETRSRSRASCSCGATSSDRASAQNDPDTRGAAPHRAARRSRSRAPLDDATLAQRMLDTIAFVRATSLGVRVFGEPNPAPVPFVSNEPNSVGTPWSFRNTGIAAAGAVDIFYSSGTFDLGPDDALVMEGTMPDCDFANLVLWNPHMQTLDYRSRPVVAELGADGARPPTARSAS